MGRGGVWGQESSQVDRPGESWGAANQGSGAGGRGEGVSHGQTTQLAGLVVGSRWREVRPSRRTCSLGSGETGRTGAVN